MRKNRTVYLVLVCFIIFFLSGCRENIESFTKGSDKQTKSSDKFDSNEDSSRAENKDLYKNEVYYTVGMHINNPYWQDHRKGLEAAAQELGVKAIFTGEEGNNAANQIQILEKIISKEPAGILVSPIDPEGMTRVINRAVNSGIPIVCIDSDAPKSDRLCYFGTGNYEAGWEAADLLAKLIANKGEVGVISILGVFCLDERVKGFKDNMHKNYPDIEIVSIQNDEGDPYKAVSVTSYIMQANPDIKGIFGDNSISGVGIAAALKEMNKENKVKIVAFDKDTATIDLIEQGVIDATLVQRTFTMSYYATKFLYDYNHEKVKIASDMTGINPLPKAVDTGIIVVNKNNASKFR